MELRLIKKLFIGPRFEPNWSSSQPPNVNFVTAILIISYYLCVDLPNLSLSLKFCLTSWKCMIKCRHRRKPQKSAERGRNRLRHESKSRKLPRHSYWCCRVNRKYNVMWVCRSSQRCCRRFDSSATKHYVEGWYWFRCFETKRDSSGTPSPLKMSKIYFLETVFMQTYNPRRTQSSQER